MWLSGALPLCSAVHVAAWLIGRQGAGALKHSCEGQLEIDCRSLLNSQSPLSGVQVSYKDLRTQNEQKIANLYGFSSAKKMAAVLVRTDDGFRLYNKVRPFSSISSLNSHWITPAVACHQLAIASFCLCQPTARYTHLTCDALTRRPMSAYLQGAAEIVLKYCTRVLDTNGVAVALGANKRAELEATITQVSFVPRLGPSRGWNFGFALQWLGAACCGRCPFWSGYADCSGHAALAVLRVSERIRPHQRLPAAPRRWRRAGCARCASATRTSQRRRRADRRTFSKPRTTRTSPCCALSASRCGLLVVSVESTSSRPLGWSISDARWPPSTRCFSPVTCLGSEMLKFTSLHVLLRARLLSADQRRSTHERSRTVLTPGVVG